MKNIIIVLLLIAVGGLGFLVLNREEPQNTVDDNQTSQSAAQNTDQATKPASGKVLDLSQKNLTEVQKNLLDNKSVTVLNVSNNNLTGALPAEIRKLTNLEELDASDNKLTGIPAEIGQLSKLKIADFSNNDISGLPLEIGNLSNLETLDLRGNPSVSQYDIGQIKPKIPNAKILTD